MKNFFYNLIINEVTDLCYKNCLEYFPPKSRILDVGIGNGNMILRCHNMIKSKGLKITGIDINSSYLKHCSNMISQWQLDDYIEIIHQSVERFSPKENHYYDFILFSMSFMLFKDQRFVLDRIRPWLKPTGKVLFFQTMFRNKSVLIDLIKPRLKYLTTVDFGKVIYNSDFTDLMKEKHMLIKEDRLIKKEWFKGEYHLIITVPENSKEIIFEKIQTGRKRQTISNVVHAKKRNRISLLDQRYLR
jgi:ubiquinone/menaquinone biosynthesis C-methylase UbiE